MSQHRGGWGPSPSRAAQAPAADVPMVTSMTTTSRIVGVLFVLTVTAALVMVVTDGNPDTLLRDLDDLRHRYIR